MLIRIKVTAKISARVVLYVLGIAALNLICELFLSIQPMLAFMLGVCVFVIDTVNLGIHPFKNTKRLAETSMKTNLCTALQFIASKKT